MSLSVGLRRLSHGEGLPSPRYETDGAAGMDLAAALPEETPVTLEPGGRALIPTGLTMEIPPGYEAQIRPRSGLALKHGVTVLNAPGTVDSDYRGELGVLLVNHGTTPYVVSRGMRIAQLVFAPVTRGAFVDKVELDTSVRGAGGFGSTG